MEKEIMKKLIEDINKNLKILNDLWSNVNPRFNEIPTWTRLTGILNSFIEIISDTTQCIDSYFSNNNDGFAENYLKLLGLLSAIKIQNIALEKFCPFFGVQINRDKNYNFLNNIILNICEPFANNQCIGCSIKNNFDEKYISISQFNIVTGQSSCHRDENYQEYIKGHLENLNNYLGNIISVYQEYNNN